MKKATATMAMFAIICSLGAFAYVQDSSAAHHEKDEKAVTVTGKSACAACDGAIQGHDILLYTKGGIRVVVKGSGANYKAAHKVRTDGKQMTATLAGPLKAKMDKEGDPYLEAKTTHIEIKG